MASSRKKTTFQRAVEATPGIAGAYHAGVQALEPADRARLDDKHLASGSLFLDAALKKAKKHASANRWDYAIGIQLDGAGREVVLWLEVHHASSKQTKKVIAKLDWLKSWLASEAPRLASMQRRFVWLLSSVESNTNDRQRRNDLAEQHGLVRVQGRLALSAYTK